MDRTEEYKSFASPTTGASRRAVVAFTMSTTGSTPSSGFEYPLDARSRTRNQGESAATATFRDPAPAVNAAATAVSVAVAGGPASPQPERDQGRRGAQRGGVPDRVLYAFAKRFLDVALALGFLALAFPVYALIAFLIRREDGGPILYSQVRVGRDGRCFKFLKFRSMVRDADALKEKLAAQNEATGPIFKMKHDPRITRVGRVLRRYSLDELPQFLNVVRGDMSLVGPRPHLPCEIEQYPDYPAERLSVPPGLLCLREVRGRSNLSFEQWLALDLEYVRNRSLWLDLKILMMAVPAILKADGAY